MITHRIVYDFTATLSLLPTDQGGRKKSVFNHYRPSFSFGSKQQFSGEVTFLHQEELKPGDSAIAKVKLLPSRYISDHLKAGVTFKIFEGEKVVGLGLIKSIDRHFNA